MNHQISPNFTEHVMTTQKDPLYPPLPVCAECKGLCCASLGCSLAPEDLHRALGTDTCDRESVLALLQNSDFAIDSFGYQGKRFYFLRMKHKCFTFIGVDAMGECIALTETGCRLSYEERPKGGRYLEAKPDRQCVQHYTKEDMITDWIPYQTILASIWDEYYLKFQSDGTFDTCEENYMNYQRAKHAR